MAVPPSLTGYGVGGTPLTVTQEDFLILHSTSHRATGTTVDCHLILQYAAKCWLTVLVLSVIMCMGYGCRECQIEC